MLPFAAWRRPWRVLAALPRRDQATIGALGIVLAAMNTAFYEAIARLPLATVGDIEFLGPAAAAALPIGIHDAPPALGSATLLLAAVGVGASSSVIP